MSIGDKILAYINDNVSIQLVECIKETLNRKAMVSIDNLKETVKPEFKSPITEAILNKFVVRNGKIKRKASYFGSNKLTVKGKQYAGVTAFVNSKTGKRKEIQRSKEQLQSKIIKMKRRWKTTLKAKLPGMLRQRARSMAVSNRLGD